MRERVKKWEDSEKWTKDLWIEEVKILFRCPAEKELFTMKVKERKKRKRKKTKLLIHCV